MGGTAVPAVLVIHGPNLGLLGRREPGVYGRTTLAEIDAALVGLGRELGLDVTARQYDGEGEIVAEIGRAIDRFQGIVINPAAYTHTSVAVRDALAAAAGLGVPAVEVHLSQPQGREPFRHRSLVAAVCRGSVSGFGAQSYLLALRGLAAVLAGEREAGPHG